MKRVRGDDAARNGIRLSRNVVSGETGTARCFAGSYFRFLTVVCFLDSCGSLRKLVTPVQRPPQHTIAVFGAFGMLYLRRAQPARIASPFLVQIENNIFAQIGLVMIIGLVVAKNAILIVEFAKAEYERGALALSTQRSQVRDFASGLS